MKLQGQPSEGDSLRSSATSEARGGKAPRARDEGYAMAVLLVAMAVMAVMMTVAMPVWRQTMQREKEQELIFRGQQYVRAIGLFQQKHANATPPDLDVLVREHFLRKKYKDPITNADFVPIPTAQAATQAEPGADVPPRTPGQPTSTSAITGITGGRGGISGVASASKASSIRVYNGATHYNEWRFVYAPPAVTPGGGPPGTTVPGQRSQPGQPGQGGAPTGPGSTGRGRGGPGQSGPGGPNRGGPGGPEGPGGRGPAEPGAFPPFAAPGPPVRGR